MSWPSQYQRTKVCTAKEWRTSWLCRTRHKHDLRHSFAVATLLDWYRDGADIDARMPLLSAYLGHVSPVSTYWYLQATPELLAVAARRLEQHNGARP
jgi:integrase